MKNKTQKVIEKILDKNVLFEDVEKSLKDIGIDIKQGINMLTLQEVFEKLYDKWNAENK